MTREEFILQQVHSLLKHVKTEDEFKELCDNLEARSTLIRFELKRHPERRSFWLAHWKDNLF